jgi:hypothetical protein
MRRAMIGEEGKSGIVIRESGIGNREPYNEHKKLGKFRDLV